MKRVKYEESATWPSEICKVHLSTDNGPPVGRPLYIGINSSFQFSSYLLCK